jgi:hypothetical protein
MLSTLITLKPALASRRVCGCPRPRAATTPPAWPEPVLNLLKKRLQCVPPCPYSFAASEALRLHSFKLDRAQVRRWAIENNLAHAVPAKRVLAPVRRWQRSQIGELWQLDASPHRWFPNCKFAFPMLNMLDDCSRLFTGSKLYEREHQFWQGRLPAYFASEKISEIEEANLHIDALRAHRNAHEIHRELRQAPRRAWDQAKKENRSALRPALACPWWNYVWSVRTPLKVGADGRVPIGTQRLRVEKPPGTKVVLCLHPSGHHSLLASAPIKTDKPALLFTNQPK